MSPQPQQALFSLYSLLPFASWLWPASQRPSPEGILTQTMHVAQALRDGPCVVLRCRRCWLQQLQKRARMRAVAGARPYRGRCRILAHQLPSSHSYTHRSPLIPLIMLDSDVVRSLACSPLLHPEGAWTQPTTFFFLCILSPLHFQCDLPRQAHIAVMFALLFDSPQLQDV